MLPLEAGLGAVGVVLWTGSILGLIAWGDRRARQRAAIVEATGVEATVELLAVERTRTRINKEPVVVVELIVRVDGEANRLVRQRRVIDAVVLGGMAPGLEVAAKVGVDDPDAISIPAWPRYNGPPELGQTIESRALGG